MTRAKSGDAVLIQYTGRLEDNSVTLDANHLLAGKDLEALTKADIKIRNRFAKLFE